MVRVPSVKGGGLLFVPWCIGRIMTSVQNRDTSNMSWINGLLCSVQSIPIVVSFCWWHVINFAQLNNEFYITTVDSTSFIAESSQCSLWLSVVDLQVMVEIYMSHLQQNATHSRSLLDSLPTEIVSNSCTKFARKYLEERRQWHMSFSAQYSFSQFSSLLSHQHKLIMTAECQERRWQNM